MTKTKNTTQAVHRFILNVLGEGVLLIQPNAHITATQPHAKGVEIYTLVDPAIDPEPRNFFLAHTGQVMDSEKWKFVATIAFPGTKALHLFEAL